jgi:hypothetical protein
MRTTHRSSLVLAVCTVVGFASPSANAQSATPATPAASAPSAQNIAEARKRYDSGLKLYEDGNYEASRIEFERAMSLAPSYRILYNIGLAYKQLNNYVDALTAFERYLSEGGAEVPADRRTAVTKEIAEIRPRIARVTVTANVPGADIAIDDVAIGKAPLAAPIAVNPGVRKISAAARGHLPATKTITVGGSEKVDVVLDLQILPTETKFVERKSNPWTVPTVIGWSATGAGVVATTIFGVLALGAKKDQEKTNANFGSTKDERDSARTKTTTLSTVTDVLGITTVVFAGASVYMTIKMLGAKSGELEPTGEPAKPPQASSFDLKVGPTGMFATGTF